MINNLISSIAAQMVIGSLDKDYSSFKPAMKQLISYVETKRMDYKIGLSILKDVQDSTKAGLVFSAIATLKIYDLAPAIAYYFLSDSYNKTSNKSILYERLKIIIRNLDEYNKSVTFAVLRDDCKFDNESLFNLPIIADVLTLGFNYHSQDKWWIETVHNCNIMRAQYDYLSDNDIIKEGNLGHAIIMKDFIQ
ncbi:hypothetical protein F3P51_16605 [Bacteroides fragilis]|uniref:Uncharacterized protein n=1 Tax=Bacteroides fragilis TaxID=817 RepID=A0A642KT86_BACFG|nr:hypothetical protein F2Z40_13885 [Bacteroides fragilis]KAA5094640.1 hypothetical protein F2Z45_03360 [Bacteroides fragilis]KAA5095685.1 hypothetical protein F2Z82_01395 [Bacteroides fragilis]KAA5098842.1 hypothetical protein F2Z46_14955 [Bacteroides fragilis]KAA5109221.1 hypothetical protein F2Z51_03355 [Bacteroides fragilis]